MYDDVTYVYDDVTYGSRMADAAQILATSEVGYVNPNTYLYLSCYIYLYIAFYVFLSI